MKSLNLITIAISFILVSTALADGSNSLDVCDIIPENCREEFNPSRNGSSGVLISDEFIILAGEGSSGGGLSGQKISSEKCVRNNMRPLPGGACCSGCAGSNGVCKPCGSSDVIEL